MKHSMHQIKPVIKNMVVILKNYCKQIGRFKRWYGQKLCRISNRRQKRFSNMTGVEL